MPPFLSGFSLIACTKLKPSLVWTTPADSAAAGITTAHTTVRIIVRKNCGASGSRSLVRAVNRASFWDFAHFRSKFECNISRPLMNDPGLTVCARRPLAHSSTSRVLPDGSPPAPRNGHAAQGIIHDSCSRDHGHRVTACHPPRSPPIGREAKHSQPWGPPRARASV